MAPVVLAGGLLFVHAPARAQAAADSVRVDSARVSYRTTEIVFFAAGRAEGVRVGDTVTVVGGRGETATLAVVVSAARHGASARILTADAAVAVGGFVRFTAHPAPPAADSTADAAPEVQALAAAVDTAQAADTITTVAPAPRPSRAARRASGGLQLEELASSAGGTSALTTYQSVGSLYLTAPLLPGVELRTRVTGRWRAGTAGTTTGLDGLRAVPYELQLRLGRPDAAVNASLGRFVPTEAMGLGYLDGARLEFRLAPQQRVGVVGGFVPEPTRLAFSTTVKRGGAYWAFGGGGSLVGSLSAAADDSAGVRSRTLLASQAWWRIADRLSLAWSAEVDVGTATHAVRGIQLTNGYVSLRADLPMGFRGGLGLESHRALAADALPAPGRLNGLSLSLGRDVRGFRVDVTGAALKGEGDASPTWRGTLGVGRGAFLLFATGQHSVLFDYGALTARWSLPYRALPFNASLGASAGMTSTSGGALTLWRFSLQPELSWSLRGGVFASLGGDIGTFAGRSILFLHAGVSYHFR